MRLSENELENITEHIVGTRMDDLTQIYNGRAIIKGSANIMNTIVSNTQISLFEKSTQFDPSVNDKPSVEKAVYSKIIVNGMQFDLPYINQQFWMKNFAQVDINFF